MSVSIGSIVSVDDLGLGTVLAEPDESEWLIYFEDAGVILPIPKEDCEATDIRPISVVRIGHWIIAMNGGNPTARRR